MHLARFFKRRCRTSLIASCMVVCTIICIVLSLSTFEFPDDEQNNAYSHFNNGRKRGYLNYGEPFMHLDRKPQSHNSNNEEYHLSKEGPGKIIENYMAPVEENGQNPNGVPFRKFIDKNGEVKFRIFKKLNNEVNVDVNNEEEDEDYVPPNVVDEDDYEDDEYDDDDEDDNSNQYFNEGDFDKIDKDVQKDDKVDNIVIKSQHLRQDVPPNVGFDGAKTLKHQHNIGDNIDNSNQAHGQGLYKVVKQTDESVKFQNLSLDRRKGLNIIESNKENNTIVRVSNKEKHDQNDALKFHHSIDNINTNISHKLDNTKDKFQSENVLKLDKADGTFQIEHSRQIVNKIETQIPIQDEIGPILVHAHPATQIQTPEVPWDSIEVHSQSGLPLVTGKIYWSKDVMDLVPKGFSTKEFQEYIYKVHKGHIKNIHPPTWDRCGRQLNKYLIMEDGTPMCGRYRDPHNKLVKGEVLSFYLSRLLGFDNVPIPVLSQINTTHSQWQGKSQTLHDAKWEQGKIVALIQWVLGIEDKTRSRTRMPSVILSAYESHTVITHANPQLPTMSANQLSQLVQWGDMLIFDYLTGHYDRVASMQDGAEQEHRPGILHENIRNLRVEWQTGKLWLIDNEAGLLDGYELLYQGGANGRRFVRFHEDMLKTLCIFNKATVERVFYLASLRKPEDVLVRYTLEQDPLYSKMENVVDSLFYRHFKERLLRVRDWINECQKL